MFFKSCFSLKEEELKTAVLAVFANKQDIEGCMSVAQVASALGLTSIKNRNYQVFKTSAVRGDGLTEAMDWLADTLNRQSWRESVDDVNPMRIGCELIY